MQCRLKHNAIVGGKSFARDSIIDDELLSPYQKSECAAYDLENREGVLLLRDLAFQTVPMLDSSGTPTSYPRHVIAGEVFDLKQIPESVRRDLKEGEHYKTDWSFEDQSKLRREASETYLKQFETEPEPAVQAPWRSR